MTWPTQPFCTSSSLSSFFLMTIFGSTCFVAAKPSVWIISRSVEIIFHLSSNSWYAWYLSIRGSGATRPKIFCVIVSSALETFRSIIFPISSPSRYVSKSANADWCAATNACTSALPSIASLMFSTANLEYGVSSAANRTLLSWGNAVQYCSRKSISWLGMPPYMVA